MRHLNPRLAPRYYADVEVAFAIEEVHISAGGSRAVVADAAVAQRSTHGTTSATDRAGVAIPEAPIRRTVDLEPREKLRAVHVRDTKQDRLVTSIELLSPWNKRRGEGLEAYRRKRDLLLHSPVHLVEIDLLRTGERPALEMHDPFVEGDYCALVNRSSDGESRTSEIWPIRIREMLPVIPVPLAGGDPDVPLSLGDVVRAVYDAASYGRRIDYTAPLPPPPLAQEDLAWARELVARNHDLGGTADERDGESG